MTRLASTNKYGARGEHYNGYWFDSQAELRRYKDLLLLERAGEIRDLVVHPKIPLYASNPQGSFMDTGAVNAVWVCYYVPDFTYRTREQSDGEYPTVEDVKGVRTAVFKLKRDWVRACYGVDVLETKA